MSKILKCPNCKTQALGGADGVRWCMNGDCAFLWSDYEMIDFDAEADDDL